jgi:hypothetical protein
MITGMANIGATYQYRKAALQLRKGFAIGPILRLLITQHIVDFFGYPVLDVWWGGKKDDAKGQSVGCGVVTCEIKNKDVALYLVFCQATLLVSRHRTFFVHRVCICCLRHLLGSVDEGGH